MGASAQTTDPPAPAGEATTCQAQLVKLKAQWASLQYRIDALQVRRNQALRDGKPKVAAGYERAILQLQAKQAVVTAQIHALQEQCGRPELAPAVARGREGRTVPSRTLLAHGQALRAHLPG